MPSQGRNLWNSVNRIDFRNRSDKRTTSLSSRIPVCVLLVNQVLGMNHDVEKDDVRDLELDVFFIR
jgi:hypothetical protein